MPQVFKPDYMAEYFSVLSESEKDTLKDALPIIAVLIAGADGNFSKDEFESAKKVAHIRSYHLKGELKAFYVEIDQHFDSRLKHFSELYPTDLPNRNEIISERLAEINPILAKLDPYIGHKLYKGFISFAQHVAKASGGFLGFFGIQKDEAKVVNLPMLKPIEYFGEEEE